MNIKKLRKQAAEKRSLIIQKRDEAKRLLEEEKVDDANTLLDEIDGIYEEINDILDKVVQIEENLNEEKEEGEEGSEDDERSDKGAKEMNFRKINTNGKDDEDNEEVRSFHNYLEERDITTEGLKLDEGYVVVPEDEKKEIIELTDDIVSLKGFVTVKPVSNASGKQPVRTTAKAKLSTVKELAESPAIGVTPFTEVPYDIETKRGYIPYSEEYKQDGINLVPDLKQFIGEVVVNTENDDILTALGSVRSKTIDTVDKLKTLVNTGFSAGKKGRIKFLLSQTVFDNLDRIKDANGRYLLQESIASETGYKLLGKEVVVLDDEYFPTKDTVFIGDLKEIVYFDRSQVRVQWTNYLHFGECLGVAIRNDVGKIEDTETKVNIYKAKINIPTNENEVETP